jgi:sulfoxide reductase heme-binding subunit YedZ
MKKIWLSGWTRVLLFLLCVVPLLNLLWRGYHQKLTANPIEFITHYTGDWTIRFLLITLAITPLRAIFNQPQLIRFRRMLGLFAFFYGCLHLTTWIWLDKDFDTNEMWEDIVKRRFITAGMTGLLLMIPLAVTSTAGWVRRLGYYYWLVKSDIRLPVMYGAILALLLLYRAAAGLVSGRRSVPARRPLRPPADAPG